MPRAYGMLVRCRGFVEKITWRKIVAIYNILRKKLKAEFLTSLILKNKINKDNFDKNHKKNERKKNKAGKHCRNL
jgi:hypothetical protein